MADAGSPAALLPVSAPNPTKPSSSIPKRFIRSQIPASILCDPALNAAISLLPSNYNFEIHKSVHRAVSLSARRIALQFPEGLLLYSLPISDIFRSFTPATSVLVLADATYGACCVDDLSAAALQADLLIHYGHSCLVPVSETKIPTLYVFVEVKVGVPRFVSTVKANFGPKSKLAIAGTVQFNSAVHAAKVELAKAGYDVVVPQAKPLSAGEVLGCTSPKVGKEIEAVVFVADGRFHLEAFMIANPKVKAFRYDPYTKELSLEEYDHLGMKEVRKQAILKARGAKRWGIVLGTLGRQGSTIVLDRVVGKMEEKGLEWMVVLMSELSPTRIALFGDGVDAWVQIACPRLSIDWGEAFESPLLTTFEFEVALGFVPGWWENNRTVPVLNCADTIQPENENHRLESCDKASCSCSCKCKDDTELKDDYPMDYYAQDGGEWNSTYFRRRTADSVNRKPVVQRG